MSPRGPLLDLGIGSGSQNIHKYEYEQILRP
jgi:hypothetical protein